MIMSGWEQNLLFSTLFLVQCIHHCIHTTFLKRWAFRSLFDIRFLWKQTHEVCFKQNACWLQNLLYFGGWRAVSVFSKTSYLLALLHTSLSVSQGLKLKATKLLLGSWALFSHPRAFFRRPVAFSLSTLMYHDLGDWEFTQTSLSIIFITYRIQYRHECLSEENVLHNLLLYH